MAKKVNSKETEQVQEVNENVEMKNEEATPETQEKPFNLNDLNPITSMQLLRNALELGNKAGAYTLNDATAVTRAWEIAAEAIQNTYAQPEADA